MRIQVVVDDDLGQELQAKAQDLGFSTSSYVRYLIKNSLSKSNKQKLNMLDEAMQDIINGNTETFTLEEYTKRLQDMIEC